MWASLNHAAEIQASGKPHLTRSDRNLKMDSQILKNSSLTPPRCLLHCQTLSQHQCHCPGGPENHSPSKKWLLRDILPSLQVLPLYTSVLASFHITVQLLFFFLHFLVLSLSLSIYLTVCVVSMCVCLQNSQGQGE